MTDVPFKAKFIGGAGGSPPMMTVGAWLADSDTNEQEPLVTASIAVDGTLDDAALVALAISTLDAELDQLDVKAAQRRAVEALAVRAAAFVNREFPFAHIVQQ